MDRIQSRDRRVWILTVTDLDPSTLIWNQAVLEYIKRRILTISLGPMLLFVPVLVPAKGYTILFLPNPDYDLSVLESTNVFVD